MIHIRPHTPSIFRWLPPTTLRLRAQCGIHRLPSLTVAHQMLARHYQPTILRSHGRKRLAHTATPQHRRK